MIVKIKVHNNRKTNVNYIEVWVQRKKELDQDLVQIFQFFEDQITYKSIRRFHPYFRITSDNPAMLLSLISSLQELITEIFFNDDKTIKLKEEIPL
jgi:hypothetical protein